MSWQKDLEAIIDRADGVSAIWYSPPENGLAWAEAYANGADDWLVITDSPASIDSKRLGSWTCKGIIYAHTKYDNTISALYERFLMCSDGVALMLDGRPKIIVLSDEAPHWQPSVHYAFRKGETIINTSG